jgi:alginate O-acetyltransferase complex protein AlgI
MLFSSTLFLFFFLPIVLLGYYVLRDDFRNIFLLLASLVFFAWGGVSYTVILLISIVVNYTMGRLIHSNLETKKARLWLGVGVGINLILLGIFKYANFITASLNDLFKTIHIPEIHQTSIVLPIGISFYTFQAISYLVDIYRKEAIVQKNILRLGLYISIFPHLIAGPILRYRDLAGQLHIRSLNVEKFSYGIRRFLTGLGKKVLIANYFAYIADSIFAMEPSGLSLLAAWLGIISYTIQIYFDFSGYSDMAIGLARMFGFVIPENFNLPYIAHSIKDFWRRWHISLSTFFRDYLYIPLGGNRISNFRTYFNLTIVFFLTGLWHGANWNFVAWGMLHGLFLIMERIFDKIKIQKFLRPFQHIYTLLVVINAWVLFRADSFTYAWGFFKAMYSQNSGIDGFVQISQYLSNEFFLVLALAILMSTNIFRLISRKSNEALALMNYNLNRALSWTTSVVNIVFYLAVFILSAMYLVSESYNPFIYYRF